MLSAYFLTAVGALVWLLMRRSVDWCEARGDRRLVCCVARNSEEFLAHFTLVAAAFALASIFVLVGIGSGIWTAAFLSPIQGVLVQVQRSVETLGLSTLWASVILIGVYLLQLMRLPEDMALPRFPSALRFIRRPRPGMRSVMHTGFYLLVLLAASTVFFATQAGALTAVVSARLSEISQVADLRQDQEKGKETAAVARAEVRAEPASLPPLVRDPEPVQTLEGVTGEKTADRPPVSRVEATPDPGARNSQRLAAFRSEALDRLKGVKLTRGPAPAAAAPSRGTRHVPGRPQGQGQRFYPGYYPQAYWQAQPVPGQRAHPGYPGARLYYPQQQTASRKVSRERVDAEELVEAVHADLQGSADPARQEKAIAAAVALFGESATDEPGFLDQVARFAEEFLPSDGATAALISKQKRSQSPASSAPAAAASPTYRYPGPPVPAYPWQLPGQRPAGGRQE